MKTYVALFRGINVGDRNRLPMRELVEVLEGLKLENVKTYIQSGNVVFQSEGIKDSALSERIETAIKKSHGFTPQVLLFEFDELEKAIASNPYPKAESEPKTLHLYFLASKPANIDLHKLQNTKA